MPATLITKILTRMVSASPTLRRQAWRVGYDYLARRYRQPDWTFMNFGYASLDANDAPLELAAEDEPDRYFIQLYDHLLQTIDLTGRAVLEVGCGRGGGCSYLARYFQTQRVVGLDFSPHAVALCRKRHPLPGLTFCQGSADALPWREPIFDVVVNVESSHCYPSFEAFVAEVFRVLQPGGYFLWTDGISKEKIELAHRTLVGCGFLLRRKCVITPNVLRALDLTTDWKEDYLRQHVPALLRRPLRDFVGIRSTKAYEDMRTGAAEYVSCILQKPELSPAPR